MKIMIVVIVIIGLSIVAGSIVIGSRMFEGTVNDHPYETGLSWDRMQREKEASGLSVAVKNDGFREGINALDLDVLDKGSRQLKEALIAITVSRPSTTAYDKTYSCERLPDGLWHANVTFPLYGYWDLKIRIVKGPSSLQFTKKVFAR